MPAGMHGPARVAAVPSARSRRPGRYSEGMSVLSLVFTALVGVVGLGTAGFAVLVVTRLFGR